jgi:hypothetical protein
MDRSHASLSRRPGKGKDSFRKADRIHPRLEALGERLAPGDASLGGLLGWGVIAAADVPVPATAEHSGSSHKASLLADLDRTDRLTALTEGDRAAEPAGGTVPTFGASPGPQQSLPDPGSPQSAPASRLVAEGQGNAVSSASAFITAPPGPGNPAPAFAAVAGAARPNPPSTLAALAPRQTTGTPAADTAQVLNSLSRTGLSFEPNVGQMDKRVDYLAHTGNATVFLTPTAAVFAMQKAPPGPPSADPNVVAGMPNPRPDTPSPSPGVALYMDLVGANPAARPVGREEQPGKVNYFKGNDPTKWHTDIPTYGRVEYQNIYPGISLSYYSGPGGLEYDFSVNPGADAHAIALRFDGADGVELDGQGNLVVHTAAGDLVEHAPVLYQQAGGQRQPVSGRFLLDSGLVRFDVGAYDSGRALVIDPLVLGYSTFLGGSNVDVAGSIAVDGAGSAYVTGITYSADFPATPGAFDTTFNSNGSDNPWDAFVAKLRPDGSGLVYATYLGGFQGEEAHGIAVDGTGCAYATGKTGSSDFPVTPGAFDTTYNGGHSDAYVTKLNPSGSALVYSTYLGGSGDDIGMGISVDAVGRAYVAGWARSADFPTTPGAFDTTYQANDGFVTKFSPTGAALVYSTFLGGTSLDYVEGIAVDPAGRAVLTGVTKSADFPTTPGAFDGTYHGGGKYGYDAFAAELTADGGALVFGTYLGGTGDEQGLAVGLSASGNVEVVGFTSSPDFPTTPGAFQTTYGGGSGIAGDAFVVQLNAGGTALVYATYVGGSENDGASGVALDAGGNALIFGQTQSPNFPTTVGAFDATYNGAGDDFVAELNPSGSALVYATYLGGSDIEADAFTNGLVLDGAGNAYVIGGTNSADFPTTPGAFDTTYNGGPGDAFVAKFCERACRVPAAAHAVVP